MCFAPQRRALFRQLNDIGRSKSGPSMRHFYSKVAERRALFRRNVQKLRHVFTFDFEMCFAPQRRALFRHRNVQKWSERPSTCFATLFTSSKCASRHNGVHFFDISTSKSRPNLTCFVHFYFQMCFAPQRRALFPHLNFQKCSEHDVF